MQALDECLADRPTVLAGNQNHLLDHFPGGEAEFDDDVAKTSPGLQEPSRADNSGWGVIGP